MVGPQLANVFAPEPESHHGDRLRFIDDRVVPTSLSCGDQDQPRIRESDIASRLLDERLDVLRNPELNAGNQLPTPVTAEVNARLYWTFDEFGQ